MGFAPIYLANRLVFRLSDFFRHWYVNGTRVIAHHLVMMLENMDRTLALRVTLHFFFAPLYGDYSVIGRILGVIFRTIRILIAVLLYALAAAAFLAFYIVWLLLPFLPLYMAYRNLAGI